MKRIGLLLAIALASNSIAQNPNVLVKFDAIFALHKSNGSNGKLRAYDLLGRHSVVTLATNLEPGFDLVFSERLQRIANDPDDEQLDEYYIEDRNYWRVGKSYIPFGRGQILRESVYGGTLFTRTGSAALPLSFSAMSGPKRRQSGFAARVGERLGASGAIGDHLGIAGTSLTVIRRPEDSPGRGRGHQLILGTDYASMKGHYGLSVEHVIFRKGETVDDRNLDVTDLVFKYDAGNGMSAHVGLSREWNSGVDAVRLGGQAKIVPSVFFEPMVRWKDGRFWDMQLGIRIKP